MIDTARPTSCKPCQQRADAIHAHRDPYTREALYEDTRSLLERADAVLARTAREGVRLP